MSNAVSTARQRLAAARRIYAEADAHAASLPTEGFNADKALTPAIEARGRAQRAVWRAEEDLKSELTAANTTA